VINAEPKSGWTVAAEPAQFRPDAVLELRNVAFRYADVSPDVLKSVSLALARGDFIAIRGGSGEGKSTLLKVLVGLLDPTVGEVLLGGRPLTQPGFRALRDRSGVVLQGEQLFSGTIIENISWFGCERDAARVTACAEAACIHDDIIAMPMGYHTVINDSIVNLSGGQVQRILLARALYREPDFLFLDEATSALDPKLEEKVVDMLQAHPAAKICISHRSLTLERADIVYRLEGGMLHEEIDRRPEAMRCVGVAGE
jgi:ATP-binding cassette subfamily B protein RaxB